jgi:predicted acyl esterase
MLAADLILPKAGGKHPVILIQTPYNKNNVRPGFSRLIVSSSDSPRYAVNFNDGGPMYEKKTGQVALNKIYCDKQHASALMLPAQ